MSDVMTDAGMDFDEVIITLSKEIIKLQERVDQLEADLEDLGESMKEPSRIITLN